MAGLDSENHKVEKRRAHENAAEVLGAESDGVLQYVVVAKRAIPDQFDRECPG